MSDIGHRNPLEELQDTTCSTPREFWDFANKVEVGSWTISGRIDVDESDVVPQTNLLLALGHTFLLVGLDAVIQSTFLSVSFNAEICRGAVRRSTLQKPRRGGIVLDGN